MILAILAIWFGYKKARDTGRNPWLWAAIAAVAFVGTQLLVGIAAGVLIQLGVLFLGWSPRTLDDYGLLANIPAIVLSIFALWVVFRFLDRVPKEEQNTPPPPPPTFGEQS
jgi:uncharacterized BrkB/YihY/UPF0761 family membrane protein